MSNQTNIEALDLPMSAVAPVRLGKNADEKSCGLFLPYRANHPMSLVVDCENGGAIFDHGSGGIVLLRAA